MATLNKDNSEALRRKQKGLAPVGTQSAFSDESTAHSASTASLEDSLADLKTQPNIMVEGTAMADRSYINQDAVTYRDKVINKKAKEDKADSVSGYDKFMDAAMNEHIVPAASRWLERKARDVEPDAEWELTPEQLDFEARTFNPKERTYLDDAISEQDYKFKQADIAEDRQRNAKAAENGLEWTLGAAVLDPAGLILGLVTAPLTGTAKASRLLNTLRTAGAVSAESMAIEGVLLAGDTQKTWKDVVIAGVAGGAIGAGFGAVRKTASLSSKNSASLKEASQKAAQDVQYKNDVEKYTATQSEIGSYKVVVNDTILKHAEIAKGAEGKVKSAEQMKAMQVKIDDLSSLAIKIKKPTKKMKKGRKANKIRRRAEEVKMGYAKDISALKRSIDANTTLIRNKAELEKVNAMSEEARMAYLVNVQPEEAARAIAYRDSIPEAVRSSGGDTEFYDRHAPKLEESSAGGTTGAALNKAYATMLFPEAELNSLDDALLDAASNRYDAALERSGRADKGTMNWTRGIPDVFLSDYSRVNLSDDAGIQSIGHLLLDNPQLGDSHTVSTLASLNDAQIRKAGGNAMDRGFLMYLQETSGNGLKVAKDLMSVKKRRVFEKTVSLAIKGIIDEKSLPPSVILARDGVRNQFAEALRLRKLHGERHWDKISRGDNYLPDIMDGNAVRNLSQQGLGKKQILDLLTQGYAHGQNDITPKMARVVAEIKYDSMSRRWLTDEDAMDVFRAEKATDAERLMKEANVPQHIIDDFFKEVFEEADWGTASARARTSLKINWEAGIVVDGKEFKIGDIMETNVSKLAEAYTLDSAFGAALAEMGIKSMGQLNRLMNTVEKQAIRSGIGSDSAKNVSKHMKILRDNIIQLKGRPIVDYSKDINKAGRVALDATSMLRLQQVGWASVPEIARAMTEVGVFETFKAVQGSGIFRAPELLAGKNAVAKNAEARLVHRQEMEAIEEMIGFVGEADFNRSWNVRSDDFGSEMTTEWTEHLDSAMEGGRRVTSWISGHQYIQGGIAKLSALGTSRRLLKSFTDDTQKLPKALLDQVRMTGMSDERFAEIGAFMKDNHKKVDFKGRKVPAWDKEAMQKLDSGERAKRAELVEEAGDKDKLISAQRKYVTGKSKIPAENQIKMEKASKELYDIDMKLIDYVKRTEATDNATSLTKFANSMKKLEQQKKAKMKYMRKLDRTDVPTKEEIQKADHELSVMQNERMDLQIKIDAPIKSMERDIQVLLQRLLNRSVLKSGVGDLNSQWLGAGGRFLTQFRTFSLGSLEKQFIADIRGADASSIWASKFMYGTGLAMTSYFAQQYINRPEDFNEEVLDPSTWDVNTFWGVFNKHSQLAAAGIVVDVAVLSGMLPEEVYDPTRYAYQNSNIDSFIPALGLANDALQLTSAAGSVLGSLTGVGDANTEDALKKVGKELRDVTPFINSTALDGFIEIYKRND